MNDALQLLARRIAERGREALVARLRPVFAETARVHAGGDRVDGVALERMVEAAADRAGGALWRRALADVAMEELEIGLDEAVRHPAVLQAQELLGVPGYGAEASADPSPSSTVRPAFPTRLSSTVRPAFPTRPSSTVRPAPPGHPALPPRSAPTERPEMPPAPQAIRIAAVHLEGIETLRAGARHIELRFSDVGLDVIGTFDGEAIGRLTWEEITAIELPKPRRSLRRRRPAVTEIVVRTDRGQARFELPALSEEQARAHLAPVLARPRGAQTPD